MLFRSRGIAIREWECWARNNDTTLNDLLLTVFTDGSCSALRSDVTDAAIAALPAYFGIIAKKMKANSYETRYRIDSYNCYQHPDVVAGIRNITAYSLLDNPTGIYVEAGETFYVLVGDTYGESISIGVNAHSSSNVTSHDLSSGVNKITTSKAGLLYVMYHSDRKSVV